MFTPCRRRSPRRPGELRERIGGISPKVLTDTLRRLESASSYNGPNRQWSGRRRGRGSAGRIGGI
ncbi:winged helix-turn-helix transcriptional regulator [Streptomyces sp. NPDC002889]|uniref:winged helix-turn-helix transcriptional regulator n=1 Tax=Streptomyces sp. NPDC002889 TaxID=3364669 RepID=UPI00368E4139